jgi:hypothetical protein
MGRGTPGPQFGRGPSSDTIEAHRCECGGERFAPTNEVVLMYDRLNPTACGPAQILEFSCVKCKTVYVPTPKGLKKLDGDEVKVEGNGNG